MRLVVSSVLYGVGLFGTLLVLLSAVSYWGSTWGSMSFGAVARRAMGYRGGPRGPAQRSAAVRRARRVGRAAIGGVYGGGKRRLEGGVERGEGGVRMRGGSAPFVEGSNVWGRMCSVVWNSPVCSGWVFRRPEHEGDCGDGSVGLTGEEKGEDRGGERAGRRREGGGGSIMCVARWHAGMYTS